MICLNYMKKNYLPVVVKNNVGNSMLDRLTPFRMSLTPDLLPAVRRWIQRGRLFPGQQESPEDLSLA